MGAVVIALAERREQKQRAEFRQHLHERFDRWLDTLEAQMTEPKPTLEQITRAVRAVRQELTRGLAEALVEQRYRAEQAQRSGSMHAQLTGDVSPRPPTLAGEQIEDGDRPVHRTDQRRLAGLVAHCATIQLARHLAPG